MSKFLKMGIAYIILMLFLELSFLTFGWVPNQILNNYGQFIVILLPVLVMAVILKVDFKERFKLKKFKPTTVLFCVVIFIAALPINTFLAALTARVLGANPNGIEAYVDALKGGYMMRVFIIAISPAICEEMMFRGLLLDKKIGLNYHVLAIMGGLMFSLFHVGFDQLLYTFSLGIIFSYTAIITGSIFPAMILHFFNNGFSVYMQYVTRFDTETIDTSGESLALFPTFISAVIGVLVIVTVFNKLKKDYGYDDQERLRGNGDTLTYRTEKKWVTFAPVIVMMIYVISLNILINL